MSESLLLSAALAAWHAWYTASTLYYQSLTPETRKRRRDRAILLGREFIAAANGVDDPGIRWGVGEVEIAQATMTVEN